MKWLERLKNEAKLRQIPPDKIYRHYVMERFLYRLSLSPHADKFCLKGGMLLLGMGSAPARNTQDIDLLGRLSNDPAQVARVIADIIRTRPGVQDGVTYSGPVHMEEITKDALYVGVRASFTGHIGSVLCPMTIDIGFSDEVFPHPHEMHYPATLSELPSAHIKCYTPESVVAEKWQGMIQLGPANSRMKDFYDLWFISRTYRFEAAVLREAILRTCARRNTPPENYVYLRGEAYRSAQQQDWAAYIRKLKAAVYMRRPPVTLPSRFFGEVLDEILDWLSPLMEGAAVTIWKPGRGWLQSEQNMNK